MTVHQTEPISSADADGFGGELPITFPRAGNDFTASVVPPVHVAWPVREGDANPSRRPAVRAELPLWPMVEGILELKLVLVEGHCQNRQ